MRSQSHCQPVSQSASQPVSQSASQSAPIHNSKAADTSGLTNELILFHIGIYPAAVNGASR
ncbi:hypothetical protein ACUYOF_22840 [Photobacterium ganghwense]|uniref:hypothetical protein n=1 Tax=Photobacterium ganghwense TaxID=320778 RepID=UPI0040559C87